VTPVLSTVLDTLTRGGPGAAETALAGADGPAAVALRRMLAADAHLLGPIEPPSARAGVLLSRLAGLPELRSEVASYTTAESAPRLLNRSPAPDRHHPALLRSVRVGDGITTALAIAPDGTWLATGGRDTMVRLWDVGTGRRLAELAGHGLEVRVIAVAPDLSWLAAAGFTADVHVWDLATGALRATLTGHPNLVYDLAAAPDGSWLAVPCPGAVWIWDTATWTRAEVLDTPHASAVAAAPDGRSLAVHGSDQRIRIFDTASWEPRQVLQYDRRHAAVALAPDGTWLVTTGGDDTIRIWDVATGHCRPPLRGGAGSIHRVAIAPDGGWLATGDESTVRFWDPVTGDVLGGADVPVPVYRLVVAPDERWFATLHADAVVRIWDLAAVRNGKPRPQPADHEPSPADMVTHHADVARVQAVAPDGAWLARVDDRDRLVVLDAVTGRLRLTYRGHGLRRLQAMAIAPDGSWVASASDRDVRLWDPVTGADRLVMKLDGTPGNGLAIAPDGSWLAIASHDQRIRLKDARTGKNRRVLNGHTAGVYAVAIAPDGTWLASAGGDATVRIWDATTGRQRGELHGHTGSVETVAISADGARLASGGRDGTARIWDVRSATLLTSMRVDQPVVRHCCWLPDGVTLCVRGRGEPELFAFVA
jgi:WD40 repeat protein